MKKCFIFAGQSNAQGYGNRTQLTPVPSWAQNAANGWEGHPTRSSDSGIEYQHPTALNSPSLYCENNSGLLSNVVDGWGLYDGCNPTFGFHSGEQGGYGPELSFLARYRAEHPTDSIAAIKVVLGGSGIDEWLPGSNMWQVLSLHISQAKARLVGVDYEWAGLLWHQGENGASSCWSYLNPTPGQEYSDKLRTLLAAVRSITSSAMPIAIARIGNHMLLPNIIGTQSSGIDTPANRVAATEYRRSQQALVAAESGNELVDTDNLPVLQTGDSQWWYHHTGAGYLALGERAYAAWQRASGETPPPPPTPLRVLFNGVEQNWLVKLNGIAVGGNNDVIEVSG